MKAQFNQINIDCVKIELSRLLPNVKSSHRVEAMARGLGWSSNASLRAELAQKSAERIVNDHTFKNYLEEHHFPDTEFGTLGEAVTRCLFARERSVIEELLVQEPRLTNDGLGIFDEVRKPRDQRQREFAEKRKKLSSAWGVQEFMRAIKFLSEFGQRKTINRKIGSYGLKHQAEDFFRDRGTDCYVSNGALIAAALHLGFKIFPNGLNAYLNISFRTTER